MKNYIQPGNVMTIPAPTGGVVSGAPVISGSLVGIADATAAEGENVAVSTEGVFELAKAASQAWTLGAKIYWSAANSNCTTTASGNTLIGIAAAAADAAATLGLVKIGPTL